MIVRVYCLLLTIKNNNVNLTPKLCYKQPHSRKVKKQKPWTQETKKNISMCMRGEGKDAKYTLLDYMKSETLERPGDPNITEITTCAIYRPRPCLLGLHG